MGTRKSQKAVSTGRIVLFSLVQRINEINEFFYIDVLNEMLVVNWKNILIKVTPIYFMNSFISLIRCTNSHTKHAH